MELLIISEICKNSKIDGKKHMYYMEILITVSLLKLTKTKPIIYFTFRCVRGIIFCASFWHGKVIGSMLGLDDSMLDPDHVIAKTLNAVPTAAMFLQSLYSSASTQYLRIFCSIYSVDY